MLCLECFGLSRETRGHGTRVILLAGGLDYFTSRKSGTVVRLGTIVRTNIPVVVHARVLHLLVHAFFITSLKPPCPSTDHCPSTSQATTAVRSWPQAWAFFGLVRFFYARSETENHFEDTGWDPLLCIQLHRPLQKSIAGAPNEQDQHEGNTTSEPQTRRREGVRGERSRSPRAREGKAQSEKELKEDDFNKC